MELTDVTQLPFGRIVRYLSIKDILNLRLTSKDVNTLTDAQVFMLHPEDKSIQLNMLKLFSITLPSIISHCEKLHGDNVLSNRGFSGPGIFTITSTPSKKFLCIQDVL